MRAKYRHKLSSCPGGHWKSVALLAAICCCAAFIFIASDLNLAQSLDINSMSNYFLQFKQSNKSSNRLSGTENVCYCQKDEGERLALGETANMLNFASRCNPNDLVQLQHSGPLNNTVLIPSAKKTVCPRKVVAGSSRLPFTALASFPGSGNTWMRHILQQLTGIYTGAIYTDESLRLHGFPYEGMLRNVIAVKTHGAIHSYEKLYTPINKFDRVLVIVRNVYESFLAQYKFKNYRNHTINPYIDTESTQWKSTFALLLSWWETYMSDIFSYSGPILIVYYEDMRSKLLPQLIRIADFLRTKEVTDFSFCCVVKEIEGNFHRKPGVQTIHDVFDKNHRLIVNSLIEKVVKQLPRKYKELSHKLLSYKLTV